MTFAKLLKGDVPGHAFHGNQYQDGASAAAEHEGPTHNNPEAERARSDADRAAAHASFAQRMGKNTPMTSGAAVKAIRAALTGPGFEHTFAKVSQTKDGKVAVTSTPYGRDDNSRHHAQSDMWKPGGTYAKYLKDELGVSIKNASVQVNRGKGYFGDDGTYRIEFELDGHTKKEEKDMFAKILKAARPTPAVLTNPLGTVIKKSEGGDGVGKAVPTSLTSMFGKRR